MKENDSYVELWQVVGKSQYIARYTYRPKRWYYISDPFGYRELSHMLEPDGTVIVCDQDGNELFRTSNADDSVNFNTPQQEAYAQWTEYAKQHPINITMENQSEQFLAHCLSGTPVGRFNDWLLNFQNPDLYDGANDYPENWLYYRNEQIGEIETLATYAYLGEICKIERVHMRHKICGVEWDAYYADDYFSGSTICMMYQRNTASHSGRKTIMTV